MRRSTGRERWRAIGTAPVSAFPVGRDGYAKALTAECVAALQGALVLSLGYILQRGTQGMPEAERKRMIYSMIDKVRADLVKLSIEDIWPARMAGRSATRVRS